METISCVECSYIELRKGEPFCTLTSTKITPGKVNEKRTKDPISDFAVPHCIEPPIDPSRSGDFNDHYNGD